MVERVAKAIERSNCDSDSECESLWADRIVRHNRIIEARAAIAAMREPTVAMTEAAAQTLFRENKGIEYAPAIGWRAMMDAALS